MGWGCTGQFCACCLPLNHPRRCDGLEALNQLVAEAQVDDLAEMVEQALRIDGDVNQAFALLQRLRHSRLMQRCLSVLRADPQAMALIRSRADAAARS